MPRGDETGPMGYGPRTGRGMGYCVGYPAPGFMNPGFGWRRCWFAPIMPIQPTQVWEPNQPKFGNPTGATAGVSANKRARNTNVRDEKKAIEQEQEALKQELEEIRKRIEELKKRK